jgi:uncharacterized protein YggE
MIENSNWTMTMTPFSMLRLALVAIIFAGPLSAQAQSEQRPPAVTVTGEASISAVPDIAILRAGVTSQAKTAREAMTASARLMTAVLAALKESGVAENDMQTSRLRISLIRESNKSPSAIVAAEASSSLIVRVRDINKSADVLDKMIGAGANLVSGIDFAVSDASKLLDQARVEAVADARRKAEIYAKAAGVSLGRPLSISEDFSSGPRIQMAPRAAAPAAMAMPIQAGEEKIGLTVSVSYELLR